jgi:hypothetical protein
MAAFHVHVQLGCIALACIIHEHISNGVLGGMRLGKMATAA